MNICIISREFPPETGWGGIGSYCWELAHGLSDLGNRVEVICLATGTVTDRAVNKKITIHRIDQVPTGMACRIYKKVQSFFPILFRRFWITCGSIEWSLSAALSLKELARRQHIDIVECPEVNAQGLWIRSICNLPLVVKLHTPYEFHWTLNGNALNSDVRCLSQLEQRAVRQANLVTSCSLALTKSLKSVWTNLPHAEVVANPIDHHFFRPARGRSIGEKLVVGYFGRLEQRKGIDVLYEAFQRVAKKVPNVDLWLVGADQRMPGTKRTWGEYVRESATIAGIAHRIRFCGEVNRAELPGLYHECDVCVIPSKYFENFPYACLEAMACGKPVIASDCGGIPEMVEQGVSGMLVDPNNVDALVNAMEELLCSSGKREYMAQRARRRVEEKFSRRRVAAATQALYEGIILRR